jgi:radical SAM protein with 4Fe4S-binding SPASM domain
VPDDYLSNMSNGIYTDFINGKIQNIQSVPRDAYGFISHLGEKKERQYRICIALHPKRLSIDMAGEMIMCHNFNKDDIVYGDSLYLGNIKEMKLKKKPILHINEAVDRRKRLSCSSCLVRHICNGGCVFQPPEYEEYNCKANFHYDLAIFGVALSMITNKVVKDIIKE